MDIKWHDTDPETGERRYLCAERFAHEWSFKYRLSRRGYWTKCLEPTREMWVHILEMMERRYWRRDGIEEADIKQIQTFIKEIDAREAYRNLPD